MNNLTSVLKALPTGKLVALVVLAVPLWVITALMFVNDDAEVFKIGPLPVGPFILVGAGGVVIFVMILIIDFISWAYEKITS